MVRAAFSRLKATCLPFSIRPTVPPGVTPRVAVVTVTATCTARRGCTEVRERLAAVVDGSFATCRVVLTAEPGSYPVRVMVTRTASRRPASAAVTVWVAPVAPAIAEWFDAPASVGPADRLVRRDDVQQESVGEPGAEDPATIVLRRTTGLRRARQVDTATAAIVGACDGDLAVGRIVAAVAQLTGQDPALMARVVLPVLGELTREGYLVRVPGASGAEM